MCVLVAQSCPTLFDPMDCSLPGSSVHWILQAGILEWVAISFSRMEPMSPALQTCSLPLAVPGLHSINIIEICYSSFFFFFWDEWEITIHLTHYIKALFVNLNESLRYLVSSSLQILSFWTSAWTGQEASLTSGSLRNKEQSMVWCLHTHVILGYILKAQEPLVKYSGPLFHSHFAMSFVGYDSVFLGSSHFWKLHKVFGVFFFSMKNSPTCLLPLEKIFCLFDVMGTCFSAVFCYLAVYCNEARPHIQSLEVGLLFSRCHESPPKLLCLAMPHLHLCWSCSLAKLQFCLHFSTRHKAFSWPTYSFGPLPCPWE